MLKKLLKYDLKSIFKLWWIAAAASVLVATIAGVFISPMINGKDLPDFAPLMGIFFWMLFMMSLTALILLSEVLIFIRFYKNFFSDEGYLTFTLPVKRSELLNSKLISGVLTTAASYVVCFIDICVFIFIVNFGSNIETIQTFFKIISQIIKQLGAYSIIYALEFLAIAVLIAIGSVLFMYICITIGSIIAKKGKVVVAIGIYYGVSSAIGFSIFMFLISLAGASDWFPNMNDSEEKLFLALLFLLVIAFIFMVCTAVYTWQYYLLDRKLNLN